MIVFKDSDLQHDFERDGYVVLPLLTSAQVASLTGFYNEKTQIVDNKGVSFYSIINMNKNDALVKEIDSKIKDAVLPELNRFLVSYEVMIATFLVKQPKQDSAVGFHQDLTLVDETKFTGANLWLARQDVTVGNGAMTVIPGSHLLTNSIRPLPDFPVFFEDYRDELHQYARTIDLKAGEAILFNHQLIHGSSGNYSGEPRLSVIMPVKSEAAQWQYYYASSPGQPLEKYFIDFDSYYKIEKNGKPDAEVVGYAPFDFPRLSKSDFKKTMAKHHANGTSLTRFTKFLKKFLSKASAS